MRKRTFFNQRNLVLIIIIIILSGVLLTSTGLIEPVNNSTWRVLKPIGLFFRNTVGRAFPFVKEVFQLKRIINQNSNLISENLELQSKLAKMSEMEYENEILKKELGFMKSNNSTSVIPAAIIGQSNGYLKSVVIDKGKNDGLSEGEAVISQGILVGVLTSVRNNNSEVTLITDYNSLIPVVLQESRGTGLLRGGLQGLMVEDIPLNIGIKKDEFVVTSGLGGQIPSGLLVGKITNIVSREGEIFQKAAVSSSVDFSSLEVLFVVKKNE